MQNEKELIRLRRFMPAARTTRARSAQFRLRRELPIPQSEREPTVPKRGARERKIPRAIFLCFFFCSWISFFGLPIKSYSGLRLLVNIKYTLKEPEHVQPKEGRKELAPREIKFRYRRLDTAIRERADSSQEGRKRAKDTPRAIFLCFFFLFIPNSRCSRQKSSRHGRDESRQESPMVQNRERRQPHNQLFV
jgi:hypothetical protein